MKKILVVLAATVVFVSCDNAADNGNNTKDSLDSIANAKKDVIDSTAEQKKEAIDSTVQEKKENLDTTKHN